MSAATDTVTSPPVFSGPAGEEQGRWLDEGTFLLPWVPDFLLRDTALWLVPDAKSPREAYHGLPKSALERWSGYFTKKGWAFIHTPPSERHADGPYFVRPGKARLEILDPGRFFTPHPQLRLRGDEAPIRLLSLEKRKPFDPWRPTYIRAVNFIKKYSPIKPVPRAAQLCFWEIEESGEVPGATSWENAELLLSDLARDDHDLREVIGDIFLHRPEDFPLGSQVYLRTLGCLDDDGYAAVCAFHTSAQRTKRHHVAEVLGQIGRPEGLETLLVLAEDHEPDVREAAGRAIGRVGIGAAHPLAEKMRGLLETGTIAQQVWAAEALLRGGDASLEKFLIEIVKEKEQALYHMGELGKVLADLGLVQAVPFLLKRLKSDRVEIRDDAAEVLRELTGLRLDYPSLGNPDVCRESARRWKSWWEDYKTRSRAS